ncbi:MAG: phosphotransferase family protein [Gammaproteobacteria bacterium]|nr:phosphotransferase family protein [Gammaproteobacteria bacterium]
MSAAPADARIATAVQALGLARPKVVALDGGVANRSYRLRAAGQDLALKLTGESADALGANPQSELAMHSLAAGAGLAPPVVLADPARGFIVSRFVTGRVLSADDFGDPRLLLRVGAWVAALHALPVPAGLPRVDLGERAAGYLARVVAQAGDRFARDLMSALALRRAALPPPARPAACHHDLHHRNFIDDGARLMVVDWEYGGSGDPAADLASCIGYHDLGEAAVEALLAGYGSPDAALRARIAALGWIFDCLWYAWNAAAELAGLAPDPAEQARLAARLAH